MITTITILTSYFLVGILALIFNKFVFKKIYKIAINAKDKNFEDMSEKEQSAIELSEVIESKKDFFAKLAFWTGPLYLTVVIFGLIIRISVVSINFINKKIVLRIADLINTK